MASNRYDEGTLATNHNTAAAGERGYHNTIIEATLDDCICIIIEDSGKHQTHAVNKEHCSKTRHFTAHGGTSNVQGRGRLHVYTLNQTTTGPKIPVHTKRLKQSRTARTLNGGKKLEEAV